MERKTRTDVYRYPLNAEKVAEQVKALEVGVTIDNAVHFRRAIDTYLISLARLEAPIGPELKVFPSGAGTPNK